MDGRGRHEFSVNQCEKHIKSDLDTISLSIDSTDTRKLKFLIDTGAEISVTKSSGLTPGVEYQLQEGVVIKGITVGTHVSTMFSYQQVVTINNCKYNII
jgi:hypothetical protein